MTDYFELWRVSGTDDMILRYGDKEIRFDMVALGDLKDEIRGWELRYYGE